MVIVKSVKGFLISIKGEKTKAPKASNTETKIIIIAQQQDFPIWNVSYVSNKFNLINIKINAIYGEVIEETSGSLLSFKK